MGLARQAGVLSSLLGQLVLLQQDDPWDDLLNWKVN
jgi:hypothetical protein